MPNQIGTATSASMLAHYQLLENIRAFCLANGWTILRYDTVPANRELIMRAPGLSGTEEIYVGIRTYQDVASDFYNLCVAGFTGYVPANTFDTQPGVRLSGVPAHNLNIDYWLSLNGQRLTMALKVGTPIYTSAYIGKFLPYATPGQYPYPLLVAGMTTGAANTRFSDTALSMPYKGNRGGFGMRFVNGSYQQPFTWPWSNNTHHNPTPTATHQIRPANTTYPLLPVILHNNASDIYGELDGIYSVTGFNNAVENTIVIGGVTYLVVQDVYRTSFVDYFAMRLDP